MTHFNQDLVRRLKATTARIVGARFGNQGSRAEQKSSEAMRADQFATLYETSTELATQPDLPTLWKTILHRATDLMHVSQAVLMLYDAAAGDLLVGDTIESAFKNPRVAMGEGITGRVAQSRQPMIVNDYAHWEGRSPQYANIEIASILAVPMFAGSELIGVLSVNDREIPHTFTEADVRMLALFAGQAANALRDARVLEETRRRADEFAVLYDASQELAIQQDVPTLLQSILNRATGLLQVTGGAIALYDPVRSDLVDVADTPPEYSFKGMRFPLGEGLVGRVAQTRQPMIVNNYKSWEHKSAQIEGPLMSVAAVPMLASGELIGVLSVGMRDRPHIFTDAHTRLLSLFAAQAASAIRNALLLEETRRRAEELAASEARIRRLVDANIIGIVMADSAGNITQANDAYLKIIGYSRDDLLSGNIRWPDLTPAEYRPVVERASEEVRNTGGFTFEMEYVCKDGSRVPVLIGVASYGAQEGVAFVLDLTERKRAEAERAAREAAEAANRAKSEFLANISHELRSPLNVVLGFTRLLERREFSPEVKQDLHIILKSGEHLHGLINQVLDLSKVEAGRSALHEVGFDLYQELDNLKDMFNFRAKESGVQFLSERRTIPRYIRGDLTKLRQVLINLLGNAIKFTGQGSVILHVDTRPGTTGQSHDWLVFTVTDTGPGMSADEVASLFTPFTQTVAGQKAQQGTGLGLAISKSFVELMGGEIDVQSTPGRGTTMRVDMPLNVASADELALPSAGRRVVGVAPHQPIYRLLVVDDNPDARQLLVRSLAPFGFTLREAANGSEALEAWDGWRPQLIWMDLRMPVMDGRAATRHIRAAGDKSIRIIAVTASSFEEEREEVLTAGFDDFLRKPYREEDILSLLKKHLGVRFIYQTEDKIREVAIDAEALNSLPDNLRESMTSALIQLDVEAVNRAVDEIRAQMPDVADGLAVLAGEFQYDRMLQLMVGDPRKSQSMAKAQS